MADRGTTERSRSLSIHLAIESVGSPHELIEPSNDVFEFPVDVGGLEGRLFIRPSNVVLPRWFSFFDGQIDAAKDLLRTASSSAVLAMSVAGRWIAVTFGYGRKLLRQGVWEPNFGLKVTLNAIADNSIRSIDRKSFDAIARHTREAASLAATIEQFGLNVEEDLLRAVVGTPEQQELGRRLAGMDALTAIGPATLTDLPDRLERYVEEWGKQRYRARYPWVDHIAEIRDRQQAQQLDARLVERLAADDTDKIWLAVPEPIDWSLIGGFTFSERGRSDLAEDIEIWRFVESVRDKSTLSANTLRRRYVYCVDLDGSTVLYKWSVYQCLYAEIRDHDDIFLLTGGHWYQVARSFALRVDDDLRRIGGTRYRLPAYREQSEESYNRAVAEHDASVVLMDRKLIRYGGGASQIEFCDLILPERTFLHVKRYSGSSVLSHLFAQGVVSGTLFLQDSAFRNEVRSKLGPDFRDLVPTQQPDASSYEVGFAVVSRNPGSLELPFFSKVNLRNSARTLKGLGYRVTLTKIEVALSQ